MNNKEMPMVYCNNTEALLHRVMDARQNDIGDTFLRLSIDEGRSFLKVSASLVNMNSEKEQASSLFKSSGVKKTFILAISPTVKENFQSIDILLNILHLDKLSSNIKCLFAMDLKCCNLVLGLGAHRSTYPCLFCHWKSSS